MLVGSINMKRISIILSIFFIAFIPRLSCAQDASIKSIGIEELFKLAIDSSQQLRVSRLDTDIAQQRIEVAEMLRNPNLAVSASAIYLGDATLYDSKLSNKITVPLPHFGNSYSIQASQVIFRGGIISNTISVATLQQQIAAMGYKKNSMDVKLLVAASYFDLFKMFNQRTVYERNIELAKLRISNINKMYNHGMVTRNDIIRNELLITNLNTTVQQLNNNAAILTQQLNVTLGFSDTTIIQPDTNILHNKPVASSLANSLSFAYQNHPDLESARLGTKITEKGVEIAKGDRLPTITLSASNSLARPVTNISPARDMYNNGWQAGLGISYSISSLYNSKKNIQLAKTQLKQQHQIVELQRQNIEISVKSAFIKHQEARQLLVSAEKSLQLAEENFRIVDKKYLNQMAILTDLLDATNARLDAELQQKNAEISIIYTYYQLQRAIGNL